MKKFDLRRMYDLSMQGLWVLLLVCIPITSFPPLSKLLGRSLVSPLALIPAGLLLVFWLAPRFMRGLRGSPGLGYLVAFVSVALLASMLSLFLEIYPVRGQTPLDRSLRGLITLGVGLTFYFLAANFPRSENQLRSSLRWISIGGILMLLWTLVQAQVIPEAQNPVPYRLQRFHNFWSIHDLYRDRVTGLAYEPSWFADQLVVFYLPIWLGAVVYRTSSFWRRRWWVSPELLLLLGGIAALFLSYSRIGQFTFLIMLLTAATSILFSFLRRRTLNQMHERPQRWTSNRWLRWLGALLIAVFLVLLIINLGSSFLNRMGPFGGSLFSRRGIEELLANEQPFYTLASRLAFGERVMYWSSAYRVFSSYPLLGVGIGNVGFFFEQMVPDYGGTLPEIIRILEGQQGNVANAKSLWLRVLAETGVVGFSFFTMWLAQIWRRARRNIQSGMPLERMLGWAGRLALVAMLMEGFSLDTFALPHLWVILGLVTANLTTAKGRALEAKQP